MKLLSIKTRWVPALMNVVGLGIAFSVLLILMSQVWWDFGYDRFKGSKDVFVLEEPSFTEGLYTTSIIRPVFQMVADSSPDIAAICDYFETRNDELGYIQILDQEEEKLETAWGINYAHTETSVLDVFNIMLLAGRQEDFAEEGDALISESTAARFFPDRNPIGEPFVYEYRKIGRIAGIYKDRKENESLINGILIHEGETDLSLPNHELHTCYIKLTPDADLAAVRKAIGKVQLGESAKNMRITQIHESRFERDRDYWGLKRGGNRLLCFILLVISILFLVIAAFNYINFAMASIPLRIKEINTRKVFGASRRSLVMRQVFRAFLIVGSSFFLSILVMKTLSGTEWATFLSGSMEPGKNKEVLWLCGATALVLAIISSIIPALYSTSFQPALVLKGSFALSAKGGGLRMATISLQFFLSFICILCALVMQHQITYMATKEEFGFDHDWVLKMNSRLYTKVKDVRDRIRDIPGVIDVARGESPIQEGQSSSAKIKDNDKTVDIDFRSISPEYAYFFRLELVDGRLPLPDEEDVVLINESFHEALPAYGVGQELNIGSYEKGTIIGILKDFHARSLEHPFSPMAFFVRDNLNYASFMIRVEPTADVKGILTQARKIYTELVDLEDREIDTGFLNEYIESIYVNENRQFRLIQLSSILSLIITLIGILGLVWFDTRFMRKEIALRKINGATVKDILAKINRRYLLIISLSFIAAAPIAYAISSRWMEKFAYRTNIPLWLFVSAFVFVTLITILVTNLQCLRAASANPIEALKHE